MLDQITPLIITYNEEENIERVLSKLAWASQILVIDSGSTDSTLALLKENPRVRLIHRDFDSFAKQCNFGLEQIDTEWVLSLDSDYILTNDFVEELKYWTPREGVSGYRVSFIYCIKGCQLRASLYPDRIVLYRSSKAFYEDEGHGHRVKVDGIVDRLTAPILHDDRKSLERWLDSQRRYSKIEASFLMAANFNTLSLQDKLRRGVWLSVPLVFLYTLFWKRCLFDGRCGFLYVLQRTFAEVLLAIEILELKYNEKGIRS
ncbi:MAG: glycosyltransferase family 2 protein [Gammaproteobacteria bacterium]|nr:glycosyltransferase family 2 protein [Gammaproteobacteria bacterium]